MTSLQRRTVRTRVPLALALSAMAFGAASCGSDTPEKVVLSLKSGNGAAASGAPEVKITEPASGARISGETFTIRGTAGPIGSVVRVDTGIGQYKVTVRGKGKWGLHDVKVPDSGEATIRVAVHDDDGTTARDSVRVNVG